MVKVSNADRSGVIHFEVQLRVESARLTTSLAGGGTWGREVRPGYHIAPRVSSSRLPAVQEWMVGYEWPKEPVG